MTRSVSHGTMKAGVNVAFLFLLVTGGCGQEMLAYLDCQYPDVYIPTCGSDGKDYFNYDQLICIASRHPERNLTMQHLYPCACHGILESDAETPVCDSNKHTYPSRAAFHCIKVFTRDKEVSIVSEGVCEGGKVDDCWAEFLPPSLWAPLCGTDDLTYNSPWHLRCANSQTPTKAQLKSKGPCPCKISRFYKPLCASNQVTYPNLETFQCDQHLYNLHNVSILREGHCEWTESTPCEDRVPQFDESYSRGLCGSDGITYLTAQQFKCVRNTMKDLKFLHEGPCKLSEIPHSISPQEACLIESRYPVMAPVCGSDNVTYMSVFSLWCMSTNQTGLKIKSEGECEMDKPQELPDPCSVKENVTQPLCGTNNVTYPNTMAYVCAASKIKGLQVLHSEPCNANSSVCKAADDTATLDMPYVCASNGHTCINLFAFWCEKQTKPDLEVSHFDECV